MACKTCGGNNNPQTVALPLTSVPASSSTCSSCSQSSSNCTCETFCEEDHVHNTTYQLFGFTLRVVSSFVWPSVNGTVTLQVRGAERLSPGSILWNPTAGYLRVESFDFASQTVIAKNHGESCNEYTGGETLPQCTDFVVGPPPCGTGSTPLPNLPYLAADFVAPANSACSLASVTNIIGLTINDVVSIDGYQYRLGNIIDSDTVQLCNDGEGAVEGTVIQWDEDSDDQANVPLFVISSENPCTRAPTTAGVLLVCDGSDVAKPLNGLVGGQVPVWNAVTERFELRNLASPYTVCTSLAADIILDPAHVGSYLIEVQSNTGFFVGNTVIINNLYYTINTVDFSTFMRITPNITPAGIETLPAGTAICLDFNPSVVLNETVEGAHGVIDVPTSNEILSPAATVTINNTSTSRIMKSMINVTAYFDIGIVNSDFVSYNIQISINGGAYGVVFASNEFFKQYAAADVDFFSLPYTLTRTIAPGASLVFGAKASLLFGSNVQTNSFGYVRINHLSVAV